MDELCMGLLVGFPDCDLSYTLSSLLCYDPASNNGSGLADTPMKKLSVWTEKCLSQVLCSSAQEDADGSSQTVNAWLNEGSNLVFTEINETFNSTIFLVNKCLDSMKSFGLDANFKEVLEGLAL
jgi:hypothetical protein